MDKAMAMAMAMVLGYLGFLFRLSETQLLRELRLKIVGEASRRSQFIPILDLTDLAPGQIPGLLQMPWEDEEWYFFCDREKLHANGNQFKRKGKSGFWKITGKGVEIVDSESNEVIGKKKILVHQESQKRKRTEWVIHEYSLNDPLVNNKSASLVVCKLKKKPIKTVETTKSKRVKTDGDISESLRGEPSGYTESNLEIPPTPAEIVWEGGDAEGNYGSILPQKLPPLNEGESSYDVNSIGKTSRTENSVVSNSVIDSIQQPNLTEGHKDMPTSHGFGESDASMEELLNYFCDPDENMCGPETTVNISNEYSQKTSLEIPTSSQFDELPDLEELLKMFSTDDDMCGKTIDDNSKESSQLISSEMQISSEFDEERDSFKELLRHFTTDGGTCRKTTDDIFNGSCQQTSLESFLDNPVIHNIDAEGGNGQEYVHSENSCGYYSPENSPCLNEGEPSYNFPSNSEPPTATLGAEDFGLPIFSPDNRMFCGFSHPGLENISGPLAHGQWLQ